MTHQVDLKLDFLLHKETFEGINHEPGGPG